MNEGVVVLIKQAGLGSVPEREAEFGVQMLDSFLHSLESEEVKPAAICLYTDGVRMACKGSGALLGLKLLAGLGVPVICCGTCLDRFGLREQLEVGEIGTMKQIVRLMMGAHHVITV